MPKPRHQGSRDSNHGDVAAGFESVGCTVANLPETGLPGFPDLLVGCMGVNHLVEVKNLETAYGRAGFQPSQAAWARDWRGGKVWIVHSRDEAIALVQAWRKPRPEAP